LSTTIDSKHHNLTFQSGCNVLYHPSTSSITPLIRFSFIHIHSFPKTPNPIFHISHISFHRNTKQHKENAHVENDTKQQSVVLCFLFYNIVSPFLFVWSCFPCIPPHCPTFFSSFLWYNFLLFDSLFFFWWWWHCSYYNLKAKLEFLDSLLQGMELLFNFLSFLPSFLPLCLICFFNIHVLILKFYLFHL
jgi:hypothetical protein